MCGRRVTVLLETFQTSSVSVLLHPIPSEQVVLRTGFKMSACRCVRPSLSTTVTLASSLVQPCQPLLLKTTLLSGAPENRNISPSIAIDMELIHCVFFRIFSKCRKMSKFFLEAVQIFSFPASEALHPTPSLQVSSSESPKLSSVDGTFAKIVHWTTHKIANCC